jgi:hypothetical protein
MVGNGKGEWKFMLKKSAEKSIDHCHLRYFFLIFFFFAATARNRNALISDRKIQRFTRMSLLVFLMIISTRGN